MGGGNRGRIWGDRGRDVRGTGVRMWGGQG